MRERKDLLTASAAPLVRIILTCLMMASDVWAQTSASPTPSNDTTSLIKDLAPLGLIGIPVLFGGLGLWGLIQARFKSDRKFKSVGWADSKGSIRDRLPTVGDFKGKSAEMVSPSFYFALEGQSAEGDRVEYGTDVDLVFNYALPPKSVLSRIKGKYLDEIIEQDEVDLGLTVIPTGFTFRDAMWFRTAKFRHGKLEERVRFHLTAVSDRVDAPGMFIILSIYGCVLYQFPIRIRLVRSILDEQDLKPTNWSLNLDLNEILIESKLAMKPQGARS